MGHPNFNKKILTTWTPKVKQFRFDDTDKLDSLNNYFCMNYNEVTSSKLEYYKTMYSEWYGYFRSFSNHIRYTYFKNNHRIFIYWIIKLSKDVDLNILTDTFNDLPFNTRLEQIDVIEQLTSVFDPKKISKTKLNTFKSSSLNQINKQIGTLKNNFVNTIHDNKKVMQINLVNDNTVILGSGYIQDVKKLARYYVVDGYDIIDKIATTYEKDKSKHTYVYILKKNNSLPVYSLN